MSNKSPGLRIIVSTIISILLFIVFIGGSIKAFSYCFNYTLHIIESDNKREQNPNIREISIKVTPEMTTKDIAKVLYEKDFISNETYFTLEGKFKKLDNKLKQGEYSITSNMSSSQIFKLLTSDPKSDKESITFTIPEGYTIVDIAEKLDKLGIVTKDKFLEAAKITNRSYDYDFLKGISSDAKYAIEGFLFPATYTINKGATPEQIIVQMLNKFEQVISNYSTAINDSTYSLNEILTIASIIEQEAKLSEERPIIAGVIYNRLQANMQLQMCSTIQYILTKRKASLSYSDLEVNSPYNTYKNKGLPPSPICSPGEASISAAIMPEDHNYYYFVLTGDEEGSHAFGQTASEHEKNKIRYKQTVDKNFYE